MSKLALLGGEKVRNKKFPAYSPIGNEEEDVVSKVMQSGVLSRFLGAWHKDFYGGPNVRAFEEEWSSYFKVNHAISVNSASSGLIVALGAAGIGPGDEVIVTPYSMCISATAPLFYGAIPVFADIERDYFCLDVDSIESKITPKTKAIIVVDLFGQPYDAIRINALAKKHNLIVIEDASQSPQAKLDGVFAGTLGDIGVFSLNYHKHIHCGEGGVVVTNNSDLAERCRLIRNHAEAALASRPEIKDLTNMLGYNMRMGEIEAAIARVQLTKLENLVLRRVENVSYVLRGLSNIPFIKAAKTRPGATHSYYLHAYRYDDSVFGVPRDRFLDAVRAELEVTERRETEGVKICGGYVKPLYMLPLFQKKIAVGREGYPFTLAPQITYEKGMCPIVERYHESELFYHELIHPNMSKEDLDDVIGAFIKVVEHIKEL